MTRLLLGAAGVFALSSALVLLSNLYLAHRLTPERFAEFALLYCLFSVTAMIADAGTTQKYQRFFIGRRESGPFNWPRILAGDALGACALAGLGGVGFALMFPVLAPHHVALVTLASIGHVLLQWLTTLLRGETQAWWVAALQRAHGFGLALLAPAIATGAVGLATGAGLLAISVGAVAATGFVCFRLVPAGSGVLPAASRADARSFALLLVAGAAFFYGDRLLVAHFCSAPELAMYSLVVVCFQLFDLLNTAVNFVLAPYYAAHRDVSPLQVLRVASKLLLPAAALSALAVALVLPIAYPQYAALGPVVPGALAVAGAAKVLYSVLMTHLNLNASSGVLRHQVQRHLALVGLGLGLVAAGAASWGLSGASVAMAVGWSLRVTLALARPLTPQQEAAAA